MAKSAAKKLVEHPDIDDIISKLSAGETAADVSQWLKSKYTTPADSKFALSLATVAKIKDEYLDFYMLARKDALAVKAAQTDPEAQLEKHITKNKNYKERLQEWVGKEVDIKNSIRQTLFLVESRVESLYDQIQDSERGDFKADQNLIQYFNLLLAAIEKANKLINDAPDQVIQHNHNIQMTEQHMAFFSEIVRDILKEIDYDASMRFMEMYHEKFMALKGPPDDSKPKQVEIRLAEAKLLSEHVADKTSE